MIQEYDYYNCKAMTLKDLKCAIDKAIEDLGEDTKVFLNYTEFANPLYHAMSVYSEHDPDVPDQPPFVTISRHTKRSINIRIANNDVEGMDKIYFSKD